MAFTLIFGNTIGWILSILTLDLWASFLLYICKHLVLWNVVWYYSACIHEYCSDVSLHPKYWSLVKSCLYHAFFHAGCMIAHSLIAFAFDPAHAVWYRDWAYNFSFSLVVEEGWTPSSVEHTSFAGNRFSLPLILYDTTNSYTYTSTWRGLDLWPLRWLASSINTGQGI